MFSSFVEEEEHEPMINELLNCSVEHCACFSYESNKL